MWSSTNREWRKYVKTTGQKHVPWKTFPHSFEILLVIQVLESFKDSNLYSVIAFFAFTQTLFPLNCYRVLHETKDLLEEQLESTRDRLDGLVDAEKKIIDLKRQLHDFTEVELKIWSLDQRSHCLKWLLLNEA